MAKNDFKQLERYKKNAKAGYRAGFTLHLYSEQVEDELYETHQYFLPCQVAKRVRFMRNFFQTLHDPNIPVDYRRRQNPVEFAETCIMVLSRVDMMCSTDSAIVAGSKYVSGVPWAIFGERVDLYAQNDFRDLPQVAQFYKHYLTGACYPISFHFRSAPNLPKKIAKKYKKHPNWVMALAVALCYDIVRNCGPDCFEFFDLFTNDSRESPENFNLDAFQSLRCKILGVERLGSPLNRKVHYVSYKPKEKVPFRAKTTIEELEVKGDDLADGCYSRPTFPPQREVPTQTEAEKYRDFYSTGLDDVDAPCPYGYSGERPAGVHGLHFRHRGWCGGSPNML